MELEQRELLNFMPFFGSGYSVAFSVEELASFIKVVFIYFASYIVYTHFVSDYSAGPRVSQNLICAFYVVRYKYAVLARALSYHTHNTCIADIRYIRSSIFS